MRLQVFLPLFLASTVSATEITTGFLLGPRYDPRSFYIRTAGSGAWSKTYSGSEYRREAQGKLMNLRLAQALYHDEWLTEKSFSPEENTNAVIAALDFYKRHGVLMINVSLQGGSPGEDGRIYGLDRRNGHRYGPGKGIHVSAFRPDGSLKPEWMARLDRLLAATTQRGMVVNLMYFYQGQDEVFESPEAIFAAACNATDWLIEKKFRNVLIDIANEWDLRGDRWEGNFIPDNIPSLLDAVRARFQKKRADFALPIGVSSDGRMNYPASMMDAVDYVAIHGNGRTPEQKSLRAGDFRKSPRPVLMTEDDNGRASTEAHLARELASCNVFFERGAGWGYMPWVQAQRFPFRYLPGKATAPGGDMPEADRDMAYFHAVLDHIASLTMRRDPHK